MELPMPDGALIGGHTQPAPLAARMRPRRIEDIIGQDDLLAPRGRLRLMLDRGELASLILWGPPGCGKTSLARVLAAQSGLRFQQVSAVSTGAAELRKIFAASRRGHEQNREQSRAQKILLFMDEIHRFNRAQQDIFLPWLEEGEVILIGATTENPSFELNPALVSRCIVFVMARLDARALRTLFQRAEHFLGHKLPLDARARELLPSLADGDGRVLLNMVELLASAKTETPMDEKRLMACLDRRLPLYDKNRDSHYNLISALHKSLRASDCDAGLYWLARMLQAGEDPAYIARRLMRFACEDVGLADPHCLVHAEAAWKCYERLGSPEGDLALAQLVVLLATAPRSNAVYDAWRKACQHAKQTGSLPPPLHSLNAPTRLMKKIGYGKDYQYDHDFEDAFSGANYFPENTGRQKFYKPAPRGFEREIIKRLEWFEKMRARKTGKPRPPETGNN